jgi:hypothetical protein
MNSSITTRAPAGAEPAAQHPLDLGLGLALVGLMATPLPAARPSALIT